MHDVERKYIIDRGTRAAAFAEWGHVAKTIYLHVITSSTIMLKFINAVGWIVRAWWYQRLSEIEIILVPVRHQQILEDEVW